MSTIEADRRQILIDNLLKDHLKFCHGALVELLRDPRDHFLSLLAVHGGSERQLNQSLHVGLRPLRSHLLVLRKSI